MPKLPIGAREHVRRLVTRDVARRAAIVSTLVGLILTVFVVPASAATTYTRSYSVTKSFYSSPLQRCLKTTLYGKVRFQRSTIRHGSGFLYRYSNIEVLDPTMRLRVRATCSSTTTRVLSKASLRQRWYESRCKADVRVSAGFPWAVSASSTYYCGTHNVATRRTTYSTRASSYHQYNSGRPFYFAGSVDSIDPYKPLCLAGQPTVTAYLGSTSDSWSTTMRPCVKP